MNVSHQLSVAICELDFVKIEQLLRNGANPNEIIAGEDFSAIHLGAGTTKSITELLLYHGANPNLQTSDGSTPLHVAVSWGKTDVLKTLLKYGADETIRDNENIGVTELAQYLEFWDCFDILQRRRKRRINHQLKGKQTKYRLRQSVDMPAQVKVNVHHDCIEVFTEELERKSDSWNKDLFHIYERNRGSPLMSACFRLPQNSDKESCSGISEEISIPSATMKTKKHLKAGSTDPYFNTEFRNESVEIEDKTNSAENESVKINRPNRLHVENKRQKYSKNTASKSSDQEYSYINNSNEDVHGIRNRAYIDRCPSDETEERNRSSYLVEPEIVFKSIAKDDSNSDESTVNVKPVSTVTPTMKNNTCSGSYSEESLDIRQINTDIINHHHHHHHHHHHELEEKNVDKYEDREDLSDQINCEEIEPPTDNYCLIKKPEDKRDDSSFCLCDQKLRIKIDLSFEPLKLENQNDQNSKIRNTDRSQSSILLDDMSRGCFKKRTRNEQSMTSKNDMDKPDNRYNENNNITYEFTENASGNPVVRVDASISHDLQSMSLDKHISEHKKNDCSVSAHSQERNNNGENGQRQTNSVFRTARPFQYPKEESEIHRKKKRTCKLIRNLKKRFRKILT